MHPPSVDRVARALASDPALHGLPHPWLVEAARAGIAEAVAAGTPEHAVTHGTDHAHSRRRASLQPIINATGVLLHTNLGRAPQAATARETATSAIRYANIELDLEGGRRGSRRVHAEPALSRLTGAEAALVVNNCAAAVMLVLAAHAKGREVIVSRGELVEIGGGFRIPDVLEQSGARLVEVGTTNRTRLADVRAALDRPGADIAMVLKVHQSNYRIVGFTEEVATSELATLGVSVVADIGSGLLDATTPWLADASGRTNVPSWLADEPAARQTLDAGAALAVFSGDKLLGGPQAGIIAGSQAMVDACARHPLARALRPGALVLDALGDVLNAYLRNDGQAIPFWRMATTSVEMLQARARTICAQIKNSAVTPTTTDAVPGGGTLPDRTIPSFGVRVSANVDRQLRFSTPAVVARIHDGATILDLRTVDPADDAVLVDAICAALAAPHRASDPATHAATEVD